MHNQPPRTVLAACLTNIYDPYKTYTIAQKGGNYNNLQSALDHNSKGNELFIVYPGTYSSTINFTANNQCIIGIGQAAQNNFSSATTICNFGNFTGCRISNIKFILTNPISGIPVITGNGELSIHNCVISISSTNNILTQIQPHAIGGNGTIYMKWGGIIYNNSGSHPGSIKAAIRIGNNSYFDLDRIKININCSNSSLGTTLVFGNNTGTLKIIRSELNINDPDTTALVGYYNNNLSGESSLYQNNLHIISKDNDSYGLFLNGSAEIKSYFNHVHITPSGSGKAYTAFINATSSFTSHFDEIIANDGAIGPGVPNSILVNSPEEGKLHTTSGIIISPNTANISNPPTDAELDAELGTPANVGTGFIKILNDNNAGNNVYLVLSDGTNWWQTALTKCA